jgi:hypothetical protein
MRNLIFFFLYFTIGISLFASNKRYRLVLTDDPATTIMIAWDQISGTNPKVYYDTTDYGTNWSTYSKSKTVDREIVFKGMNNNFVKLTNLLPKTNYYFVVKDSEGVSERFWFKTAPNTNKPLSFIAGGDSRNNRLPRQNANRIVAKLKPNAIFFGGDMTSGDTSNQWIEWFDDWQLTTSADGRMYPIIPARGNHEFSNMSLFNLFNVPSINSYYDISFGNNLFTIYTLNTELPCGGYQYKWLKNKLQTNNSIWKSAQYHKAMRPHVSGKPEGNDQYYNWAQLFYEKQVKLIFESDSHDVKSTWPIKPCNKSIDCEEGFVRDDESGSIYLGEGCWGAPLRDANDAKNWTRNSGSFNQFKWICVTKDQITIKTIIIDDPTNLEENSNIDNCNLPDGIHIWNPSNGDTIIIEKTEEQTSFLKIIFPENNQTYLSDKKIEINVDTSFIDEAINLIVFKVDNKIIGILNKVPFILSHSFIEGNHKITAHAFTTSNKHFIDSVNINIKTCDNTSINTSVSQDVEESEYGYLYMDSSDLELVYDSYNSQGTQTIGLYFNNICLPKNAIIENAYIQFTADGISNNIAEFLISAELTANAQIYQEHKLFDVSNRIYSSSLYWKPNPWYDNHADLDQRTPDLSKLIQDLISQSEWEIGNSLAFKIEGIGNPFFKETAIRKARSKESNAAPKLIINYTEESIPVFTEFNVFPNPVDKILYFKLPTKKNTDWKIEIFDLTGKRIFQKNIIDDQISVANLASGNYIIKVFDSNLEAIFNHKISILNK